MLRRRRWAGFIFSIMFVFAMSGCGGGGGAASKSQTGLTRVDFEQNFIPTSVYTPFLVALDKGFYEEEGIEFINHEGSGSATAVKVVGAGQFPIGISSAGQVLAGVSRGVPIKAVSQFYAVNPTSIISLKESGINTLQDLAGKKLGEAPETSSFIELKAALELNNMSMSDLEFVNLEPSAKVAALLEGKVDAITGQQQPADIRAQGKEVSVIKLADYGLDISSDSLIVNESYLKSHPDIVRGVVKGTLRGISYTLEHVDEAVEIMLKHHPTLDPDITREKIKMQNPWLTTPSGDQPHGFMDIKQWELLQDVLFEGGQLEKKVDISQVITNDYLP